MQNDVLVKSFKAEGAIAGNRIVTLGVASYSVAAASAVTETLVGVTHNLSAANGEQADVVVAGTPMVKAGAAITKGSYVTTNASGEAIAVSVGTDRTIGIALEGASTGDLIPVLLSVA